MTCLAAQAIRTIQDSLKQIAPSRLWVDCCEGHERTRLLVGQHAPVVLLTGQLKGLGGLQQPVHKVLEQVFVDALSIEFPGGSIGGGYNDDSLL